MATAESQTAQGAGSPEERDKAIADFAAANADQNELDFEALKQAVSDGRIEAEFESG